MNDRVTDRAAAHATQAELAVRDWLLVGLSFAAGIYEAIVFLTFGKVFTAAQTGNLVLLGTGVAALAMPILKLFPRYGHGLSPADSFLWPGWSIWLTTRERIRPMQTHLLDPTEPLARARAGCAV